MGKLEDALAGGGFPSAMPEMPELTMPQQMACAARMLAHQGYALDVAGHITAVRPDPTTVPCGARRTAFGGGN